MNEGQHREAAQDAELDAGAVWLEDEHYTLIEDEPSDLERPTRYDQTQRIWCPAR